MPKAQHSFSTSYFVAKQSSEKTKGSKTMAKDRPIRIGNTLVPYDDATQEVTIERTVVDILKAKPGDDQNCMNSMCIKAQRNQRAFPHPVYAVSTIKTRVYIVDALTASGEFAHAVRYELGFRDQRLIHDHDAWGAGEPGTLTLRVPVDPKGSPIRASQKGKRFSDGGVGGADKKNAGKRNRPVTGSAARYRVAVGALDLGS